MGAALKRGAKKRKGKLTGAAKKAFLSRMRRGRAAAKAKPARKAASARKRPAAKKRAASKRKGTSKRKSSKRAAAARKGARTKARRAAWLALARAAAKKGAATRRKGGAKKRTSRKAGSKRKAGKRRGKLTGAAKKAFLSRMRRGRAAAKGGRKGGGRKKGAAKRRSHKSHHHGGGTSMTSMTRAAAARLAAHRWHHHGRGKHKRGPARKRNPGMVGSVKETLRSSPSWLRRAAAVGGGFLGTGMLTGAIDGLAGGRLGRANQVVGALSAMFLTYAGTGLIGKVPVAGKLINANLGDIRLGIGAYALKAIITTLVPSIAEKLGMSGSLFMSPMAGMNEYVQLPGGPGVGHYDAGNPGDGGTDDVTSAVRMTHANPMQVAERLFAEDEKYNRMQGLGSIGELDDETITQAIGEYVRMEGMGDYISQPMSEYIQSAPGIAPAMGNIGIRSALGNSNWGSVYQGLGEDEASAPGCRPAQLPPGPIRNMVDFPPEPRGAITAQRSTVGECIDESYGDELGAHGIFQGGPFG
jgi:adenylate kinase/ribonuclease R